MSIYTLATIASKDDSRPVLTGVHLENGKAYATNGYMLAVEPSNDETTGPVNVPVKHIKAKSILAIGETETKTMDLKSSGITIDQNIIGNYPVKQSEEILKEARKNKGTTFGIGLCTLEPLVSYLKRSGEQYVVITLSKEPMKGMYAKLGDTELVIIPVRVNR